MVTRTHWFGEDVASIDTTLEAAPSLMPVFDRRPFGANRFHDVIERRPGDGADALEIALVSKQYVLVQHASVVKAVTAELPGPRSILRKCRCACSSPNTARASRSAQRCRGISTTGVDGRPVQRAAPHRWQLTEGQQVPGTHAPCEDGYEIAQVLCLGRRGGPARLVGSAPTPLSHRRRAVAG